jgi:hypothetical protein
LLLLYVLAFQEHLLFGDVPKESAAEDYSASFWANLAIKELWLQSGSSEDPAIRGYVYPEITGLLAKLRPQLLDPQTMVKAFLESRDNTTSFDNVQELIGVLKKSYGDIKEALDGGSATFAHSA